MGGAGGQAAHPRPSLPPRGLVKQPDCGRAGRLGSGACIVAIKPAAQVEQTGHLARRTVARVEQTRHLAGRTVRRLEQAAVGGRSAKQAGIAVLVMATGLVD
jgi:hypothetical protein